MLMESGGEETYVVTELSTLLFLGTFFAGVGCRRPTGTGISGQSGSFMVLFLLPPMRSGLHWQSSGLLALWLPQRPGHLFSNLLYWRRSFLFDTSSRRSTQSRWLSLLYSLPRCGLRLALPLYP